MFERAPALIEAGAGVQLSPNATRRLRDLGVLDAILPACLRPERVRVRRARDGRDLAEVPLGDRAEARYGAPFLLVHRADLQAALAAALATQPTVSLRLGAGLRQVTDTAGGVAVRLDTGEDWHGAALIGADGLHSVVRRHLAGTRPDPLHPSTRTAWRALVPAEIAPGFAREPASALWLGPGAHLVHYPIRNGRFVNVVAVVDRPTQGDGEDWAKPGAATDLLASFADWSRDALALLAAAPAWRVWPLFTRAPLAWSSGRVALVGDAAHPMLPFLAQGAAQGIEDAAALAAAMADGPDMPAALRRYEAARRPRAERVVRTSRGQGTVYHLAGPAARARDLAFRLLGPDRMLSRLDWLYGNP